MTFRISEYVDEEIGAQVIGLEGSLTLSSIELLEQTFSSLRKAGVGKIQLDVKSLTFIDPESARILRRMLTKKQIILRGCQLFVREIIEGDVEES